MSNPVNPAKMTRKFLMLRGFARALCNSVLDFPARANPEEFSADVYLRTSDDAIWTFAREREGAKGHDVLRGSSKSRIGVGRLSLISDISSHAMDYAWRRY